MNLTGRVDGKQYAAHVKGETNDDKDDANWHEITKQHHFTKAKTIHLRRVEIHSKSFGPKTIDSKQIVYNQIEIANMGRQVGTLDVRMLTKGR